MNNNIQYLILNISVFIVCIVYNYLLPLFCIPVHWTILVLLVFCGAFLIFPFINKSSVVFKLLTYLIGFGFFLGLYLILFGSMFYIVFLIMHIPVLLIFHFGIKYANKRFNTQKLNALYFYPMIVLMPYIMLYQLFKFANNMSKSGERRIKVLPSFTAVVLVILALRIGWIVSKVKKCNDKEATLTTITKNPVDNYLTELILGAHWKYHTEMDMNDGKRPPFHDPVLVVANKLWHPFSYFDQGVSYEYSQKLYKKVYPKNNYIFDCECGKGTHLLHTKNRYWVLLLPFY